MRYVSGLLCLAAALLRIERKDALVAVRSLYCFVGWIMVVEYSASLLRACYHAVEQHPFKKLLGL